MFARGFLNFSGRIVLNENSKLAFTFSQFTLFNIAGTTLRGKESESLKDSSTNTRS